MLEQRIELMLTRARSPHSVPQIWNSIAGTDPEEVETKDVQLLIKTETCTGPQGGHLRTAVCTSLWTGPELCNLQAKFSRELGETETDYLLACFTNRG